MNYFSRSFSNFFNLQRLITIIIVIRFICKRVKCTKTCVICANYSIPFPLDANILDPQRRPSVDP